MNEDERYQYFMRCISEQDRNSVGVIVKHVASGKSVKINYEGQIIYHQDNKASNIDTIRKELYVPSKFTNSEKDILVERGQCIAKPFIGFQIWCDETGQHKELPINEKATTLFMPQFRGRVLAGNILLSPPFIPDENYEADKEDDD